MNRNNIPLILMLVAGAVTCIINLIQNLSILGQMASLLIVLVIFYFLGNVLKWTLNHFEEQNEKERKEREEAEKAAEGEAEAEGQDAQKEE